MHLSNTFKRHMRRVGLPRRDYSEAGTLVYVREFAARQVV